MSRLSDCFWRRMPSMSRLSRLTALGLVIVLAVAVIGPRALAGSAGGSPLADAARYGALAEAEWVRPQLARAHTASQLRRRLGTISTARASGTLVLTVRRAGGGLVFASTREWKRFAVPESASVRATFTDHRVVVVIPDRWRAHTVFVSLAFPRSVFAASGDRDVRLQVLPILAAALLAAVLIFNAAVGRLRRDAHALRAHAEERAYLSEHDSLTGLPNRLLLQGTAHQLIMRRGDGALALLMIDLDEFKEINDTLGHSAGDRLLRDASRRLRELARGGELVARLGGDEFAILTPQVQNLDDAVRLGRRIVEVVSRPFHLEGLSVEVRPSVGIAVWPNHAPDFQTLLRFADIAMYQAKQRRTGVEVYRPGTETDRRLVGLGGELRKAIADGQLTLRYQPKAALQDGTTRSLEALVRWEHPTRGVIPPDHFIPLAERSGLIRHLTQAVLEQACIQARTWNSSGHPIPVAVNLSTRDVIDQQLVNELNRLLTDYHIAAGGLELEITEGVLMADPGRARSILGRLKDLGCTIAIDDFGTGYSSLAYLRQLPLDSLKIDRTFVRTLDDKTPDEVIVRSTIDLAHNLGLAVIAEGVETQAAWTKLAALGCDYAQGYYISRPLEADRATAFLAQDRRAA
jgi:diguanylate cyclase (GGDEF)-like protein